MEHLSEEKLAKYAARQISVGEMTAVMLHLENCRDCFTALQNLLPAVAGQSVELFADGEAAVFHLDYDDHLQPFVDNEADVATREIVESHSQICSGCAFQLRELREFSESLRFRGGEKVHGKMSIVQKTVYWVGLLSKHTAFQFAAGFFLLMLIAVAIFVSTRYSEPAETAKILISPSVEVAQNQPSTEPAVPTENNQTNELRSNKKAASRTAANKLPEAKPPEENDTESEFAEIAGLPENLRRPVEIALQTHKLTLPPILKNMSSNQRNLRGDSSEKTTIISPDREVVRAVNPTFKWKKNLTEEKYIVEIFDEQNDTGTVSSPLSNNRWKPNVNLQRGKTYKWELRSVNKENTVPKIEAEGTFKILDAAAESELSKVPAGSPLLRGIIFASHGLVKEARNEFYKAARKSPTSPAKEFLRQLPK